MSTLLFPKGSQCASIAGNDVMVMDELMRLNKIVGDCEHTLRIMERSRERRKIPQADFDAVQSAMKKAQSERDWLEGAIGRLAKAS